jgi:DHA1 family bicyclomycin/chloramphenicol resistance-like MFS transporter
VTARELIEMKLGRAEFTLMLSMTMAVVALAIDIVLPAFGDMRDGFGLASDSNDIAAIITFFFFGLAAGQLVWGPLSDAFGRKKILYLGLAVYVVAAIASVFAPSLQFLLISRFIWGIGAAGPQVVARSVVRDTYEGADMARAMSFIMAIFILVPIIAPTLGSVILLVGTWRWVFGFTAIFGAGIALWTLRLPETLPVERRIPFRVTRLTTAARFVVTNRMAMGYTLAQMTVFGFFASYLASSQLILDDVFGVDALFPVIFGASAAVMGVFMLLNTKLLKRFELRPLVRSVFTIYLVGGLGLAAVAWATDGSPSIYLFYAAMLPIFIGHALLIPNLNAIAMIPMGAVAGMAAAIIGTMATLGGSVIGIIIDRAYNGTITPFAIAAALSGIVAFGLMLWADRGYDTSVDRGLQIPDPRAQKAAEQAALAPITGMDA